MDNKYNIYNIVYSSISHVTYHTSLKAGQQEKKSKKWRRKQRVVELKAGSVFQIT